MTVPEAIKANQKQKEAADQILNPQVGYNAGRLEARSAAQPQMNRTECKPPLPKTSSRTAAEALALLSHTDDTFEICSLLLKAFISDLALTLESPALRDYSLSPTSVRAVLYLFQRGGQSASLHELAKGIHVSDGWASRLINKLAVAGLVSQIRDGRDRRLVQLCLTEQATMISIDLWNQRAATAAAALTEIVGDERTVIKRFLCRLTTELARNVSKASAHCG